MSNQSRKLFIDALVFSSLYFIMAMISLYLSGIPYVITKLWLSDIIGIVFLLRYKMEDWSIPLITIGFVNFLAYYLFGNDLQASSYFMLMSLSEIVVTVLILRQFKIVESFDQKISSALILIITVTIIAPTISASLTTLFYPSSDPLHFWLNGFVGDGICMVSLLPVMLCLLRGMWREITWHTSVGLCLWLLFAISVTIPILVYLPYAFIIILVPLLIVSMFNSVFFTLIIVSMNVLLIFTLYNSRFYIPLILPRFDKSIFVYLPTIFLLIIPYLLAVFMSILAKAKENLHYNEALFRSAMENAGVGMALVSLDGRWSMVNNAFCKMLGYSEVELKKLTAQDITHPDDRPQTINILKKLKTGKIELYNIEKRYISKSGDIVWVNLSVTPVRNQNYSPKYYVAHMVDITHEKLLQKKINYQATHDSLTGLLNRREFEKALNQCVQQFSSNDASSVLCYLDLDYFKTVNDSAGHTAGDAILQSVARLFEQHLRKVDVLARLGGDEFGILLSDCSLPAGEKICQQLIDIINSTSFAWEDKTYKIGLSIGMVLISNKIRTVDQWLADADAACYSAKAAGRNQVFVYQSEDGLDQ